MDSDKVIVLFEMLETLQPMTRISQPNSVRLSMSKPRTYINDVMQLLPQIRSVSSHLNDVTSDTLIRDAYNEERDARNERYKQAIVDMIRRLDERLKLLRKDRLIDHQFDDFDVFTSIVALEGE